MSDMISKRSIVLHLCTDRRPPLGNCALALAEVNFTPPVVPQSNIHVEHHDTNSYTYEDTQGSNSLQHSTHQHDRLNTIATSLETFDDPFLCNFTCRPKYVNLLDLELYNISHNHIPAKYGHLPLENHDNSALANQNLSTFASTGENHNLHGDLYSGATMTRQARQDRSQIKPRNKRNCFDRNALFRRWLRENASRPYPSTEQITAFAAAQNMKERQVRVAFSNLRSRMKLDHVGTAEGQELNLLDSTLVSEDNILDLLPLDDSLLSASLESSSGIFSDNLPWITSPPSTQHGISPSATSSSSPPSLGYTPQLHIASQGRKGKKRHASRYDYKATVEPNNVGPSGSPTIADKSGIRKYHCTICPSSFKHPFDWKRHEEGVHWHTDTLWICMLHVDNIIGTQCIYCEQTIFDMQHVEQHKIRLCSADHVFSRKDLLKQHVQQVHLKSANEGLRRNFQVPMDWSRSADILEVNLDAFWCGFCSRMFDSVSERMDHVKRHFQDGVDINTWVSGMIE